MDVEKIFSCDDISEFIKRIKYIMAYDGESDSKFFICDYKNKEFLVKLTFNKKTRPELYQKESKNRMNMSDTEIEILLLLKEKIIKANISPCILELLCYKRCPDIKSIKLTQDECDKYIFKDSGSVEDYVNYLFCERYNLYKAGLIHNGFNFLILEQCDITFHDYINHFTETPVEIEILKSLLFQIVYTFYAICKLYPEFRHRDLHSDNVMIKYNKKYKFSDSAKYEVFYTEDAKYCIPYFGLVAKVIDFGFSSIPEKNIVSYVAEDITINHIRTRNDLIFLFHDILQLNDNPTVREILEEIDISKSFIHFDTEYIKRHEDKIPSYRDMLNSDVFSEYKNKNISKDEIWHEYSKI